MLRRQSTLLRVLFKFAVKVINLAKYFGKFMNVDHLIRLISEMAYVLMHRSHFWNFELRLREQIIKLNAELQYGRISFEDERNERKLGVEIAIQGETTLTQQHCHIEIKIHRGFTHHIPITIPILDRNTRLQYQESWNEAHLKTALLNKISTIIRQQADSTSLAEYSTKIETAVTEILLSAITNLMGSHLRKSNHRAMLALPGTPIHRTTPSAPPHPVSPPVVSKPQQKASPAKTDTSKMGAYRIALPGLVTGSHLPRIVEPVEPPSPPGSPTSSSWKTLPVAAARAKTRLFSQVDKMVTPP